MTLNSDLKDIPKSGTEELAVCPVCGSDNNEIYKKDFDVNIMWADVRCHDCRTEWQDNYTFIGWKLTAYKGAEVSIDQDS